MTYSGQSNLKPVWPETGGKSPNLIFADCEDLDRAGDMAAFGIFFNHGEVCSANSRLYVERSIKDAFVERMIARGRGNATGRSTQSRVVTGLCIRWTSTPHSRPSG